MNETFQIFEVLDGFWTPYLPKFQLEVQSFRVPCVTKKGVMLQVAYPSVATGDHLSQAFDYSFQKINLRERINFTAGKMLLAKSFCKLIAPIGLPPDYVLYEA